MTAKVRWTPYTACTGLNEGKGVTDSAQATQEPQTPANSRSRAVNECEGAMHTADAMHSALALVNECQGVIETAHTMHGACTLVIKLQRDMELASRCLSRVVPLQVATHHTSGVPPQVATEQIRQASSRSGCPKLLIRDRSGGAREDGKRQPEPWKHPVTGELVHSPGRGRPTSRGTL